MSDLTVYAEALIATVARAFYDDEAVCLIDVLIRDKFLRDDDMAPRLSLPARKLRSTLQFLQEEHLVKFETVDDLEQGGSQQTKFWYIDYNHAVHTIRLRLHLLRQSLEKAELRARSSSFYLCPGYKSKRCNGRYTEEEAQQIVNHETGLFLCQECLLNYQNDPNAPTKDEYTLQLVDNTKDLRRAMDNMRRVTVQLSTKMIGNEQIRAGVYDLLQKIRSNKGRGDHAGGGAGGGGHSTHTNIKTSKPITSNLPSENFALGIGSKRLAGTGRTAGIKARKLEQQGVADSATAARNYLVGAGGPKGSGNRSAEGSDLTFLKNAMGNEIAFSVEKGGGARANLLATKTRRHRKLMEAAASRVGASIPLDVRFKISNNKRKRSSDDNKDEKDGESKDDDNSDDSNSKDKNGNGKKSKKPKVAKKTTQGQPSNIPLTFLDNNIGREGLDKEMERLRQKDIRDAGAGSNNDDDDGDDGDVLDSYNHNQPASIELDDTEENMPHLWEEDKRKTAFQAMYSKEMHRQITILNIDTTTEAANANVLSPKSSFVSAAAAAAAAATTATPAPPTVSVADPEEFTVLWEDAE